MINSYTLKNTFWTQMKITFLVFVLFVLALGTVTFYIYTGMVAKIGKQQKR